MICFVTLGEGRINDFGVEFGLFAMVHAGRKKNNIDEHCKHNFILVQNKIALPLSVSGMEWITFKY